MNVAITGVGGGVGQAVIRALRGSRLPLTLIGLDADPWSVGLYQCDRHTLVPRASDPGYAEALERVILEHKVEALIPATDPELLPVSLFRERCLALGCQPISSIPSIAHMARDKRLSYADLSALGLPFVRTFTVAEFLASAEPAAFPVMVKPRDGSASVGARVVFSREEIPTDGASDSYIVQDYLVPVSWGIETVGPSEVVKGGRLRQEEEVVLQGVVAPDGTVVSVFVSINELRDGVLMKTVPSLDPELHGFARRAFSIFSQQGHVGPINLQGRRTREGLVIYEINPRFTGGTATRAALGFNEVEAALRLFVLGEESEVVARDLQYTEDIVCLRYMTEELVAREEVKRQA
jgi:carbamoylphosphate synthase large subunit